MSLKLFIIPTFIILSLVLAIWYVKPEIDSILMKRTEIAAQNDALQKVDSVADNIRTLSQSIKSRRETETFVRKYYPESLDEERVVDALNYLAAQSGVVIIDLSIVEDAPQRLSAASSGAYINPDGTPFDDATMAALEAALPRSFTAKASVFGAYPNLKDFFARVYQADRGHAVKVFSIEAREKEGETTSEGETEEVVVPENLLIGTLEATFPYMARKAAGNALNQPLFQNTTFDFGTADRLLNFVTSPVPTLEADPLGRTSPFD